MAWLVEAGTVVVEGKVIAHLRTPGAADARVGYDDELRAPISGRLEVLDDAQREAGGSPAAIAVVRFCTHETLIGGTLCALCGTDVSRFPERTRKAIQQWHSHSRDPVAVKLLPLLPARGRIVSRASTAGAASAAAGVAGGRLTAMAGGAASVPQRMAPALPVAALATAASSSSSSSSSLSQLVAAFKLPAGPAAADARPAAHVGGPGAAAISAAALMAGAAARPVLPLLPVPGGGPFRGAGPAGAAAGPALENLQKVHGHGGVAIHMTHRLADQTDAVLQVSGAAPSPGVCRSAIAALPLRVLHVCSCCAAAGSPEA